MSKKAEMSERVRRELEHATQMGVVAAIKESDVAPERVWAMLATIQHRAEYTDRVKNAIAPLLRELGRTVDSAA